MATRHRKNSRLSAFTIPALCLGLIAYFGYHGFNGKLGLTSGVMMDRETLHLEYELVRLKLEKDKLSHRVNLLRSGKIEKDMLDQQARAILSIARSDERIIIIE